MPFHVDWCIPDQVVLEKFSGELTLPEVQQISQIFMDFIPHTRQTVHLIADVLEVERIHFSLSQIKAVHFSPIPKHFGYAVFVVPKDITLYPLLGMLINILSKFFALRYRVVENHEQAWLFLQSVDSSLAEIIPPRNSSL